QLSFQNIQASYGPFGPERTQLQYRCLERVFFRFVVIGASADADGQVSIHTTGRLTAADGTLVAEGKETTGGFLHFGPAFPDVISFAVPQQLKPGEYTFQVSIKDDHSGQSAAFERKLTVLPDEFAICSPEFSYDSEGDHGAPFGGLVNQKLYLRFNIIGITNGRGRSDVESRFQVLDAKTRQPLCKPVVRDHVVTNPVLAQPAIRLASMVSLTTPGDFILRITATDRIANK